MAIHQFVRRIIKGEKIILYGDGLSERDYTYIDDIIVGIMASLSVLNGYEIINLGESRTVTLKKLISIIEHVAGNKASIQWEPMQPGDVLKTYADIKKAEKTFGYNPHYPIEEGLKIFMQWYKRNIN
jgi:UDP-glucuronate 4-epimerase